MGNSSSKDSRTHVRPRLASEHTGPAAAGGTAALSPADRLASQIYTTRIGTGRGSRPDLSFLTLGRDREGETTPPDRPRETKQEKEARRAERDRQARLKERERSIREEGVDGGYLVTLGTYTGPEDFGKAIVRQLQIERRLAPFWKGIDDHDASWTEAQLVAAVRGLPIPAADEIPPALARSASQASSNPGATDANVTSLTIPIATRSRSYQNESTLSTSHPAFSNSGLASSTSPSSMSSTSLLRGRAKTLASLATGSKGQATDMTPQETRLPEDPNVNGLPIEAYLYRETTECPICFLYYPPYLNHTRCCDQPICSECFVQIKRPDPHPPEHEQPGQQRPPEEEAETLVSEIAACPFCVTPEFGVTYDPPPFRRGLTYANHGSHSFQYSSSLASREAAGRRRATSLSANAPQVVTTDRVRPDWAKKLADARANALRRSAAATALHNAAYVLGNQGDGARGIAGFGRRRRQFFGDSPGASGSGTPRAADDGSGDLYPGRTSSRRPRVEDLEDLMMMEAIRLSLAAEDERKRKEEKEAAKEAKKQAKETKKEEKKADKLAKKNGLYPAGTNDSVSTWASTSMARSMSNLGTSAGAIPEEQIHGKGKQPAQEFTGSNPLTDPTSTVNRSASPSPPSSTVEAQRPLPGARASGPPLHRRHLSNASSVASSFVNSNTPSASGSGIDISTQHAKDESSSSFRSGTPPAAAPAEPMFNFRSLAAMVGDEDKGKGSEHLEHAPPVDMTSKAEEELKEPSPIGSPVTSRGRGDSAESSGGGMSPLVLEQGSGGADVITSSPAPPLATSVHEEKQYGGVSVVDGAHAHEATQ